MGRFMLRVFSREALWRPVFGLGRALRATGLPTRLAGSGRFGFGMGMLAATGNASPRSRRLPPAPARSRVGPTVALFRGCIMDTLFAHVHDATRRTLEANGYSVVEVTGQTCCGALHEHAGDRTTARTLARRNVAALLDAADYIGVNSAGCGALLKDYGHLLGTSDAGKMAAKVRDVTELLAERGPRPGGRLDLVVAYDAPCHLQHAQRVQAAPLAVLDAIPGLRVRLLPGSDRCCGSAGIYSLLQPEMSQRVLAEKIETLRSADPPLDAVVTGNPGCLMQIGAGLRAARARIPVMHPVELLERSYALPSAPLPLRHL
jgi:glycolate oxidase iron-sulfur subunit